MKRLAGHKLPRIILYHPIFIQDLTCFYHPGCVYELLIPRKLDQPSYNEFPYKMSNHHKIYIKTNRTPKEVQPWNGQKYKITWWPK